MWSRVKAQKVVNAGPRIHNLPLRELQVCLTAREVHPPNGPDWVVVVICEGLAGDF